MNFLQLSSLITASMKIYHRFETRAESVGVRPYQANHPPRHRQQPPSSTSTFSAILCKLFVIMGTLLALSSCTAVPAPSTNSEVQPRQTPTRQPLRREDLVSGTGLVVAMTFAPDGRLFYAEREGGVFTKEVTNHSRPEQILYLEVSSDIENGLLGLALAPDFAQSGHFFVYYTVPDENGDPLQGRISRFTEREAGVSAETILVDGLPARPDQFAHFGGGLNIGPDNKLYLIFGDTFREKEAADKETLPGSILRYNLDGTIPEDNPFPGSPVYAYGIRNGFDLAWHPELDLLYEIDNGELCDDELNLIEAGQDYGWGVYGRADCPYPDDQATPPLYEWTPVIAPSGMTFYTDDLIPEWQGDLLICGHNEFEIKQVKLSADGRTVEQVTNLNLSDIKFLCWVDIEQGPDGWLYSSSFDEIYRIGR